MTLRKILELGLINDDTEIWVRGYGNFGLFLLANGKRHQDKVLGYMDDELESFIWQDDNNFFINLK